MILDKKSIDFKYNLKIYLGLLKKYKIHVITIIIGLLVAEGINLLLRYLFKVVTDNATLLAGKIISQNQFVDILIQVAILYVVFAILLIAFVRWLYNTLILQLESNMVIDIKKRFLSHLIDLSYKFHTNNKTGSLINKLIKSSAAIDRINSTVFYNVIPLFFQLIITSITLAIFDVFSLVVLLIVVVVFIANSVLLNKMREPDNLNANNAEDTEKAQIADIFTNIESIKLFGKEKVMKIRYENFAKKTKEAVVKYESSFATQSAINVFIINLGLFLIVFFSLKKVLIGEMSVGTLVFIFTAYMAILQNLYSVDGIIRSFYKSMADFENLFKFAKINNEIVDKPDATNLVIFEGTLEFKNVKFSYNNNPIFENFNLKIPKNKKVAIIGPSGAGKTSLIRLIYRLYDVESGEILVDAKNINSFTQESLRSELSIVPQECVLFDDTIYNNILFSRPVASREEVMQAMKFAQLDKIVDSFPNKENTVVGERGVKLSGGEKQRVSIARAILADKKILILDEATSSLDSETESEIQKDLHNLMQGRTSIIIAHRLSTIMSADMIVVIEKGQIVQMGNHKTLIKKTGLYKKLWNLQKGGYIE